MWPDSETESKFPMQFFDLKPILFAEISGKRDTLCCELYTLLRKNPAIRIFYSLTKLHLFVGSFYIALVCAMTGTEWQIVVCMLNFLQSIPNVGYIFIVASVAYIFLFEHYSYRPYIHMSM